MVEKYREREREIIRDRKKESETGNKSLIERARRQGKKFERRFIININRFVDKAKQSKARRDAVNV